MHYGFLILLGLVATMDQIQLVQGQGGIELKVFNLNTWGISWFDDEPTVSDEEPYDIQSVADTDLGNLEENYPNELMINFLKIGLLVPKQLIAMLNPARKKKERLEAICDHVKANSFDVVFLQEVWFKKDYDRLKTCLAGENYEFSSFDSECGKNPMSVSKCSGLMTISKFKLRKERTASLPKGKDYLTYNSFSDVTFYAEFGINRKILMHDIKVNGVRIRLINTHFSPYEEFRQLRRKQAQEVKRNFDKKGNFDVAILALDMNDPPMIHETKKWTPAYKVLNEEVGFNDGYNFWLDKKATYPITFEDPNNSWSDLTNEGPQTLDYIMIKDQSGMKLSEFVEIKVEDLKTYDGISFSDHNSVTATIKIPL